MKRRRTGFLIFLFLLVFLPDALFPEAEEAALWWNKVPGFDLVLGLAGSAALILVSKYLLKHFLQRPEQYYKKGER